MRDYSHLERARTLAAQSIRLQTWKRLEAQRTACAELVAASRGETVSKVALAMLYLGEGSKSRKKAIITFTNSDPGVIALFLRLLRNCYSLDEKKFRCTVQCRADQDTKCLMRYWADMTGIPLTRFYSTRVDPRTAGKPTTKPNYKGVLRIDYFSSTLFNELRLIAEEMIGGR